MICYCNLRGCYVTFVPKYVPHHLFVFESETLLRQLVQVQPKCWLNLGTIKMVERCKKGILRNFFFLNNWISILNFCYMPQDVPCLMELLYARVRRTYDVNSLFSFWTDSTSSSLFRARVSNVPSWWCLDKSGNRPPIWLITTFWPPFCGHSWPLWSPAVQSKPLISFSHSNTYVLLVKRWNSASSTSFILLFSFPFIWDNCIPRRGLVLQKLYRRCRCEISLQI